MAVDKAGQPVALEARTIAFGLVLGVGSGVLGVIAHHRLGDLDVITIEPAALEDHDAVGFGAALRHSRPDRHNARLVRGPAAADRADMGVLHAAQCREAALRQKRLAVGQPAHADTVEFAIVGDHESRGLRDPSPSGSLGWGR